MLPLFSQFSPEMSHIFLRDEILAPGIVSPPAPLCFATAYFANSLNYNHVYYLHVALYK